VAVIHAVLMAIFIADITVKNRALLLNENVANATALAKTLATSSAGWLVARDIAGLQELVEGQKQYPELVFSMLVDQRGHVLAHTDRSHLRQTVLDLPQEGSVNRVMQNPELVDVCVPVMLSGRLIGWARVGIGRQGVNQELIHIVRNGVVYAVMAIISGSLLVLMLGSFFTRRMKVIQKVVESVKTGDLNARVVLSGTDEAAVLGAGFNQMIETLKERSRQIISLNTTLEQRVAERTHQLQCTNKELEAFAYSVSHDLRAPLRAIDGFTGFLEEGYAAKLDQEGRRMIEVIRSSCRKMDRLIVDLLSLSRTSQSELHPLQIDMRSLVNAVYSEGVPEEIRKQFKFTLESLPDVWGDPVLLRQAWVNLISNAVKYTMKSPVKEIEIGGFMENDDRVYYIKDSGVGFNPQYAGRLFGAFQRLHKAEDFEGTGIGLAIVQRIIHRHGGRVWAEGQENKGATFSFSIPGRAAGKS